MIVVDEVFNSAVVGTERWVFSCRDIGIRLVVCNGVPIVPIVLVPIVFAVYDSLSDPVIVPVVVHPPLSFPAKVVLPLCDVLLLNGEGGEVREPHVDTGCESIIVSCLHLSKKGLKNIPKNKKLKIFF